MRGLLKAGWWMAKALNQNVVMEYELRLGQVLREFAKQAITNIKKGRCHRMVTSIDKQRLVELLREWIASQSSIIGRSVEDHRARLAAIWGEALRLGEGNIGLALKVAAEATNTSKQPFESKAHHTSVMNALPSLVFGQEEPYKGDDKPQHFFSAAGLSYEWGALVSKTIGRLLEKRQEQYGGTYDLGDIYVDDLGADFAAFLRSAPTTTPQLFFRTPNESMGDAATRLSEHGEKVEAPQLSMPAYLPPWRKGLAIGAGGVAVAAVAATRYRNSSSSTKSSSGGTWSSTSSGRGSSSGGTTGGGGSGGTSSSTSSDKSSWREPADVGNRQSSGGGTGAGSSSGGTTGGGGSGGTGRGSGGEGSGGTASGGGTGGGSTAGGGATSGSTSSGTASAGNEEDEEFEATYVSPSGESQTYVGTTEGEGSHTVDSQTNDDTDDDTEFWPSELDRPRTLSLGQLVDLIARKIGNAAQPREDAGSAGGAVQHRPGYGLYDPTETGPTEIGSSLGVAPRRPGGYTDPSDEPARRGGPPSGSDPGHVSVPPPR